VFVDPLGLASASGEPGNDNGNDSNDHGNDNGSPPDGPEANLCGDGNYSGNDDGDQDRSQDAGRRDRARRDPGRGRYPDKFWRWYHENYKPHRTGDGKNASPEELDEAYEEWKEKGEPDADHDDRPTKPAEYSAWDSMNRASKGTLVVAGLLVIADCLLGGPTGEGIAPAAAMLAASVAAEEATDTPSPPTGVGDRL
jgi:hypothetical protein